jgi:ANTAR domain
MPKKRRAEVPRGPEPGAGWLQDPAGVPGNAASDVPGAAASAARDTDQVADTITGPLPVVADDAVVRRTADGWRVGDDELPDLTCAMVLADLLAAELPTDIQPAVPAAPGAQADGPPADSRPARKRGGKHSAGPAGAPPTMEEEAHRLRTTVGQLEHALTARIRVEQAIGVLAERHRIRPRQAFEQLRSAARNRGRRVIDIAADVVASATNPLLQLPEELSRQRSGSRHGGRHVRGALGSE